MLLELTAPDSLDRLDEVTVRIRDDQPDRQPRPGSQLTQEQITAVIWGPYRLRPAMENTDPDGRQHGPFRLPKGEPYPVQLEPSVAPSWAGPNWRNQYDGTPIRLEIVCRREGYEPWVIPAEVKQNVSRVHVLE